MADRIVINFAADTAAVERGADDISDSLDKVERSIEDVGDQSENAGKKTTDSLADIDKAAQNTGDEVGDKLPTSFEDLAGSAEDSLGGIGDNLLGLVGIAGGVGGAVAALVGGGVEAVTGMIEEQQEAAKQLEEDLIGAYQSASEAGRQYLDDAQIISQANKVLFDPDQTKMDAFREKAALIGVDINTYLLAQSGSYEDLQVVIEAVQTAEETRGQVSGDQSKAGQAAALEEAQALDRIALENQRLIDIHKAGTEAAAQDQVIRDTLSQRERDQIKRTSDADQARYDALTAAHAAAESLAPISIPATVQDPDIPGFMARLQRAVDGVAINVTVNGYTRDGTKVI